MHYLENAMRSDFACGAYAVGQRNGLQLHPENATCPLCRAIIDRKPVYVVLSMDEDGHKDVGHFTTIKDQVEYAELISESSPVVNIMYILLPDEIRLDDADAHFIRIQNAAEEMMH